MVDPAFTRAVVILGDEIEAELPVLRAQAESRMRDQCVVERRSGRVMDPEKLEYADVWVPIYSGRCRVRVQETKATESAEAGRSFIISEATLHLPVDGTRYRADDRVTLTSCAYDPALVGAVLTVHTRGIVSDATARRLRVSEVHAT